VILSQPVRDGYFSTVGCVRYPTGGMGIHFLNPQLIGPLPDPMRPTILLYEPVGDKLRLVGAEWFIPLATGVKEHPQLFGQPFDGPMEGHEPLMPATLHHYDLHVWLFKSNPAGLFNMVNPNVKCPKTAYTFLEHPPKTLRSSETVTLFDRSGSRVFWREEIWTGLCNRVVKMGGIA
jgi:hypothetical protein